MQTDYISDVVHVLDTNINEFKEILTSKTFLLPPNKFSACRKHIQSVRSIYTEQSCWIVTTPSFSLVFDSFGFQFIIYAVALPFDRMVSLSR